MRAGPNTYTLRNNLSNAKKLFANFESIRTYIKLNIYGEGEMPVVMLNTTKHCWCIGPKPKCNDGLQIFITNWRTEVTQLKVWQSETFVV